MAIKSKLFKGQAGAGETVPNVVVLRALVAIGATGAPTISQGKGIGIARTGTGAYTVTVTAAQGGVPAMLGIKVTPIATADALVMVRTLVAATGVATIVTQSALGTAADLASGSFLAIEIVAKNGQTNG